MKIDDSSPATVVPLADADGKSMHESQSTFETDLQTRPTYTVGVGASAGGLEALERLFQTMPDDTAMALSRGVVLTLIDITMVKEAEARFSNAVSVSPNGILRVDQRGLITMINAEVERIFGYTEVELIGKSVELLVSDSESGLHTGLRIEFFSRPRLIRRMGGMSYCLGRA